MLSDQPGTDPGIEPTFQYVFYVACGFLTTSATQEARATER